MVDESHSRVRTVDHVFGRLRRPQASVEAGKDRTSNLSQRDEPPPVAHGISGTITRESPGHAKPQGIAPRGNRMHCHRICSIRRGEKRTISRFYFYLPMVFLTSEIPPLTKSIANTGTIAVATPNPCTISSTHCDLTLYHSPLRRAKRISHSLSEVGSFSPYRVTIQAKKIP